MDYLQTCTKQSFWKKNLLKVWTDFDFELNDNERQGQII
jgi:hypothetical protein